MTPEVIELQAAVSERNQEEADKGFAGAILRTVEELIGEYLASDNTGGSAGVSSFGAMIARIELYGMETELCPKCALVVDEHGLKAINPFPGFDKDGNDCERCGGVAYVTQKGAERAARDFVSARCSNCKGPGFIYPQTGSYLHELYGQRFACRMCESCGCTTPGPTPEPHRKVRSVVGSVPHRHHEASYSMDDTEAERDGVISRVLTHLQDDDAEAHLAVRLALGTIGAHWAARGSVPETRDTFNRIFALWPLTVAGRKLIDASRRRDRSEHWANTDDHHVLAREVQEASATQVDMRTPLISQAQAAAKELWARSLLALWRADVVSGSKLEGYAWKRWKATEVSA